MVATSIGNIPVQPYIMDGDYNLSSELVEDSGNSFTNFDGTTVRAYMGRRNILKIRLTDVPDSVAKSISTEVHKEDFTVTYTNPLPEQSTFVCTSYGTNCTDGINLEWEISLTLESKSVTPLTDGL